MSFAGFSLDTATRRTLRPLATEVMRVAMEERFWVRVWARDGSIFISDVESVISGLGQIGIGRRFVEGCVEFSEGVSDEVKFDDDQIGLSSAETDFHLSSTSLI